MNIFYDGNAQQINILDERFYQSTQNPGVYFPSVTTVLDAYTKGYGFHEWLKQVGFNADEILKKAGETGSNVHAMIDSYLSGNAINWMNEDLKQLYSFEEWVMFCKFIDFWTQAKPEVLIHEMSICSDTLGFGGTIDLICKINGQIWLIDYKTSNAVHKTHELQIAAYAVAWNELNPQYTIERTGILWLKAATRGEDKKGEKLQGQGWQLKEFDRPYPVAFELFKHTQAIWLEENPNYKPRNLIYPSTFKLETNELIPSNPEENRIPGF